MQDHLGKKVRDWRKRQGWSQAKLAKESGISQPGLCLLEKNGGALPETLFRLYKGTDGALTPNYLILGEDPPKAS